MGREFIETFERWADHYDRSVHGGSPEYREVFRDYDSILEEVAKQAEGTVLEFGTGTGNLSTKLLDAGLTVFGVEPSEKMRSKAHDKLPDLKLFDGDFLDFPVPDRPVDTIVSSYAFHHLTDEEKGDAITKYNRLLPVHGKIVFADTLFENEVAKRQIWHWAGTQGFADLLKDLQTEYYSLLPVLDQVLRERHFAANFRQLNKFVWLMIAEKTDEL
ncbi:class I SAM-dependent methyltransferase [Sporolactobacillus sp. KGMB 08714]|uniref:class I SAM-dependent methyltransferase n=1 Tax=Sporolactobacillus sp. KGMB 08714 TaxID=3064704 RepID=UPI002FBE066C